MQCYKKQENKAQAKCSHLLKFLGHPAWLDMQSVRVSCGL